MTLSAQLDAFAVELPVAFDPRWNRIPGITVDGATITVDPEKYFFRFENSTWLLLGQAEADGLILHLVKPAAAVVTDDRSAGRPSQATHRVQLDVLG
jgi:hypothetical protein